MYEDTQTGRITVYPKSKLAYLSMITTNQTICKGTMLTITYILGEKHYK